MSRVYWSTEHRTAELMGSERAWLRQLARGPAITAWDFARSPFGLDRAVELLSLATNNNHTAVDNLRRLAQIANHGTNYGATRQLLSFLQSVLATDGIELSVAGVRLHTDNICLNTALVAGADPVRLAAKIDGWCEANCWIEGPDRAWAAGIIDDALRAGIYRRGIWTADQPSTWVDMGWSNVLDLLGETDDGPVVLSYSVTDGFPDLEFADWDGDEDDFYDLPYVEQFGLCMPGLRAAKPWARIAPDTLAEVTFGLPVSVYDLLAPDRDDRTVEPAGRPPIPRIHDCPA